MNDLRPNKKNLNKKKIVYNKSLMSSTKVWSPAATRLIT